MREKKAAMRGAAALRIAAASALVLLLPLRIYFEATLIDPETGFWLNKNFLVPIFYALLFVFVAGVCVFAAVRRKSIVISLQPKVRKTEGLFALLTAVGFAADAAASYAFVRRILQDFTNGVPLFGMRAGSLRFGQYLMKSGGAAAVLGVVFALLSLVFFVLVSLHDFKAAALSRKALALAPLFWSVCRLFRRFSRNISYVRVPDLFLELLALAFLLVFLLAFAQTLSGMRDGAQKGKLLAAGYVAAILMLLCAVPRAVMFFAGRPLHSDAAFDLVLFALPLFILSFLFDRAAFGHAQAPAVQLLPDLTRIQTVDLSKELCDLDETGGE
jgi:hypothetical protein